MELAVVQFAKESAVFVKIYTYVEYLALSVCASARLLKKVETKPFDLPQN